MIATGIKYGEIKVDIERGSLAFVKNKSQEVRHYPGTNQSDNIPFGKEATRLTCNLIIYDDAERILWEQLLHRDQEFDLQVKDILYKKVVTGDSSGFEPVTSKKQKWIASAEFIALDPVPYDVDSEERLY